MSVVSFKQFLVEEKKVVYFTFGRMNPPTLGHNRLFETMSKKACRNPYRIYLSHSHDSKKNPMIYENKIKYIRKMFPKHGRSIIHTKNSVRDILEVASLLHEENFKKIVLIVGDDRLVEFDILLNKYNGKKGRHGFYNFQDISVESAGHRDPDSNNIEGASSTSLREAVKNNNFIQFSQGIPKNLSGSDTKKLFNEIRVGLGLKEQKSFKRHVNMSPVSETREKYIQGELFNEGDEAIVIDTDEVVRVVLLGANYVIVENSDGNRSRKWLNAIEKI